MDEDPIRGWSIVVTGLQRAIPRPRVARSRWRNPLGRGGLPLEQGRCGHRGLELVHRSAAAALEWYLSNDPPVAVRLHPLKSDSRNRVAELVVKGSVETESMDHVRWS